MRLGQIFEDETGHLSWARVGSASCIALAFGLHWLGREVGGWLTTSVALYTASKAHQAVTAFSDKQDGQQS